MVEKRQDEKPYSLSRILFILSWICIIALGIFIFNYCEKLGLTHGQSKIIGLNFYYVVITIYFSVSDTMFLENKKAASFFTVLYLIIGSALLQGAGYYQIFSEPKAGNAFYSLFTVGLWAATNKLIEKSINLVSKGEF